MNDTNIIKKIENTIESLPVRGFDKYFLGPFLIWYGLKSKNMKKLPRRIIVTAGVWQIIYHWRDYRNIPKDLTQLSNNVKQN